MTAHAHLRVLVTPLAGGGTALDAQSINYTKAYLQTFEKNLATAKNSADLIDAMKKAYPSAQLGIALDIGAKVNKGERKW